MKINRLGYVSLVLALLTAATIFAGCKPKSTAVTTTAATTRTTAATTTATLTTTAAATTAAATTRTTAATTATPTTTTPLRKIIWRANDTIGQTGRAQSSGEHLIFLVNRIKELTNGQLEIQFHWLDELKLGRANFPKTLKEGLVEMHDTAWANAPQLIPELAWVRDAGLEIAPMGPTNRAEIKVREAMMPTYKKVADQYDFHILTVLEASYGVTREFGFISTKPITRISDLKGKNFIPGTSKRDLWDKYGVTQVPMPYADFYLAFKTGMAEVADAIPSFYQQMSLAEVAKYWVTHTPWSAQASQWGWAVTNKAWNALTPDLQRAVTQAFSEYQARLDQLILTNWKGPDEAAIEKIKKDQGVITTQFTKEDMAQMAVDRDAASGAAMKALPESAWESMKAVYTAVGATDRYNNIRKLAGK